MKKKVVVVSGFSGAGKGSLVKRMFEFEYTIMSNSSKLWLSKSDTTRAPRNDSVDNYTYITPEEYHDRISSGFYLEHNSYGDNGYGTPFQPVVDTLENGGTVVLEIDCYGMAQAKEYFYNSDVTVTTVFVCTDAGSLITRLIDRGDAADEIRKRLSTSLQEARHIDEYDYILCNDVFEETALKLWAIVSGIPVSCCEEFDTSQFCNDVEEILRSPEGVLATTLGSSPFAEDNMK